MNRASDRKSKPPTRHEEVSEQASSRATASIRASSLAVCGMLAASGGFLDGFTYIGHGRVFANAMSGNIILFAANLFIRSWDVALRYLPPLIAFLAAVWVVQAIHLHSKSSGRPEPYVAVVLLEVVVLLVLSVLPAATPDAVFTTSIAFAAAVQMQTFRQVNGRIFGSTFTTGNLRTLGEATFKWVFEGHSREAAQVMRDFSVIIASFLCGAIGGGVTTKAFGNRALWFDIGLLAIVVLRIEAPVTLHPVEHKKSAAPV